MLLLLMAGHTLARLTRTLAKADAIRASFFVFPAKEAVTQLASTNMVTIRLLPFLAIPWAFSPRTWFRGAGGTDVPAGVAF